MERGDEAVSRYKVKVVIEVNLLVYRMLWNIFDPDQLLMLIRDSPKED